MGNGIVGPPADPYMYAFVATGAARMLTEDEGETKSKKQSLGITMASVGSAPMEMTATVLARSRLVVTTRRGVNVTSQVPDKRGSSNHSHTPISLNNTTGACQLSASHTLQVHRLLKVQRPCHFTLRPQFQTKCDLLNWQNGSLTYC